MVPAALALILVAMLLVRRGWGGRRAVALAGWGLAIAALGLLAAEAGAWGIAMGVVAGTAAAMLMLVQAGWTAPAKAYRPARVPASVTVPHRPGDIAQRFAVFLLVVPVAFAAAMWLAFGVQALARNHGAGAADAATLILFLQPLIWSILMTWQMTRPGPARMIAPPAGVAVLGTMLWGLA